jgi:hypothetical protein
VIFDLLHAGDVLGDDCGGLALLVGGDDASQVDHAVAHRRVDEVARRPRLLRQIGEDARADRLVVLGRRRCLAPDARERCSRLARLTMPTTWLPRITGRRLIRRASIRRTTSSTGVSSRMVIGSG